MLTFFAECILAGVMFVAGGAVVWFYKSWFQSAVVTVNADVKAVKAGAAAVTTEVKKL